MSIKNSISNNLSTLIFALAVLALGILFCCFGVFAISYILGGFVIFVAVLFAVNSIARTRALLTLNGLVGAILATIGAMIIAKNLAGLLLSFIPFILISVGALIIADAFLRFFWRRDVSGAVFGVEIAVGVFVCVAGLCVLFIDDWANFASVVFGIALIVYSIFLTVTTLLKGE